MKTIVKKSWLFITKNKLYFISAFALLGAVGIGLIINFSVHKEETLKTVENDPNKQFNPLNAENSFAELKPWDFYGAVEIKNGFITLNEDIVARIVEEEIAQSTLTYADLEYSYLRLSKQEIMLKIKWLDENKNSISKTWKISAQNV